MALQFKTGDQVRQIVKPISGTVTDAVIIDCDVQFKVEWTDDNGERHERCFSGHEIELTPLD